MPAVNMQGSVAVAKNEHSRSSLEEAMRTTRRRIRSTATSVEDAGKKSCRRHSSRGHALTPSPLRAFGSSSVAPSQGSSIVSTVPAPSKETWPAREARVDPPPRQPRSRSGSSRCNASRGNLLSPALASRGSRWRIFGCLDSHQVAALTRARGGRLLNALSWPILYALLLKRHRYINQRRRSRLRASIQGRNY